ncbi:hypothetical protein LZ30DRAFT_211745 [Colletotrichum cereale]|nr:hypothetical protein LZ30DRAFT_211745 [Colletotrichum cereale]
MTCTLGGGILRGSEVLFLFLFSYSQEPGNETSFEPLPLVAQTWPGMGPCAIHSGETNPMPLPPLHSLTLSPTHSLTPSRRNIPIPDVVEEDWAVDDIPSPCMHAWTRQMRPLRLVRPLTAERLPSARPGLLGLCQPKLWCHRHLTLTLGAFCS